jgi:hypothetical protein
METEVKIKKPRPYWHVDAKWVFGILFFFCLSTTLLCFNLAAITKEKPATDALTLVLASMYSPKGLDDSTEIEQMKQQIVASPNGTVQPIQDMNITVKLSDLTGKTPREIRLNLFRQLVGPIYSGDVSSIISDPIKQEKFLSDTRPMRILISAGTHQALVSTFIVTVILSIIFVIPFSYFSFGWGRLKNPGSIMINVSLPFVILAAFATSQPASSMVVTANSSASAGVGQALLSLMPSYAKLIMPPSLVILWIGIALYVAGILGKIITWLINRKKKKDLVKEDDVVQETENGQA